MSKSPNSHIFIPAIGGIALVLGVAYGITAKDYGKDRIEALEQSFANERATATAQSERAASMEAAMADMQAKLQVQQEVLEAKSETKASSSMSEPVPSTVMPLGLGRAAHPDEIQAWDVDILPDGRGLPDGSGDVWTGEEVFVAKCAACHGDFAEGRGAWPVLAGGFDTLDKVDPVKTVGSYWPYLSTVWDYVHRSMPFGAAGTLTDEEVYAITAYILYSNDLIDEDFTLSRETFSQVEMYNDDGFIIDDRPQTEYVLWTGEPCMTDCKAAPAEITRRSSDVGVTPADDGSMVESVMERELAALGGVEWGKERVAGSVYMDPNYVETEDDTMNSAEQQTASTEEGLTVDAATGPSVDPALIEQGKLVFRQCSSCHQVGEGAKNRSGPQLNGIMGRIAGSAEGFRYSNAMKGANEDGLVWTDENLHDFLLDPRGYMTGTKMSFRGLKSEEDVAAILAYLASFSE